MLQRLALLSVSAGVILTGCGDVASQRGRVVLQGAVTGIYRPGPPSSCGPGLTRVTGPFGKTDRQLADLTVDDNNRVSLAVHGRDTYTGTGVTFRPGEGWDIEATLRSSDSQVAISGHLGC